MSAVELESSLPRSRSSRSSASPSTRNATSASVPCSPWWWQAALPMPLALTQPHGPGLCLAALCQVNLRIILLTGSILFTEPRPPSCRDLRAQDPLDQHPQDLRCLLDRHPARRRDLRAAHRVLRYDRGLTAQLAKKVAEKRIAKTFLITTIKGIGCNWMVCMAVFLCEQAQDMAGHQDFRNQQVHHEEHVCT